VALPFAPPLSPMLAKAADTLPTGDGWLYEPKWDGFRCVVFRDGDQVELTSRNERPFTRYFPDMLDPLRACLVERCVVDGELVVPGATGLEFDALQQRIHPAESRVRRLAAETPAAFIAFDLLALEDRDLRDVPLAERRALLREAVQTGPAVHLGPSTTDVELASTWFDRFEGAGLDGIVAKRLDGTYTPGERTMVKVKHQRTADCAVAGFRWHKDGVGIGSLLLGLHDDQGVLHHVGVCGSFTASYRRELVDEIAPLREGALEDHPWREWADAMAHAVAAGRMPGGPSRWNAQKDMSWEPLRIERVAEVEFTQLTNGRFRHNAHFLRWRPDRTPESCTYDQLEVAEPVRFDELFA
jgi:ATP-dependent DNA ligase